jgi:hypothetical protein
VSTEDGDPVEYDPTSGVYRTNYNWSSPGSLSTAVLDAISEAADCEGLDLPPLYEQIDPAGLEKLFAPIPGSERCTGSVTFPLGEYHVTIAADGEIVIYPPSED